MTMTERYAIFFAPDRDSDLWARAAAWIGRDAATGEILKQPIPQDIAANAFASQTASARKYGFHGTIKPPMRLAAGKDRSALLARADTFAKTYAPIDIGPAAVQDLDGFLAVMPTTQTTALVQFAANCVAHFEPCRAPLTSAERERRLTSRLTQRQTELLDQYGYPYVMDEFRFHMTLTDRLDPAAQDAYKSAAIAWFADCLVAPVRLDRISIYHEAAPDAPFTRIADFELTGTKSS